VLVTVEEVVGVVRGAALMGRNDIGKHIYCLRRRLWRRRPTMTMNVVMTPTMNTSRVAMAMYSARSIVSASPPANQINWHSPTGPHTSIAHHTRQSWVVSTNWF